MESFTFFTVVNLVIVSNVQAFNIYNEIDYKPKNFENISTPCMQQYNASDLMTLLQFFDASVKIPVGIGNGNFFHLGDYDECYNLETKTEIGTIFGKYCLGTIPIIDLASQYNSLKSFSNVNLPIEPRMMGGNPDAIGLHLAYCVPNTCTADDLEQMTFGIVKFEEMYCQSKAAEPELTSGAIATIAVLAIFAGFVVVSTVYDVALYYLDTKAVHELLISFSILTNGKKLISASTNPDQLLCLNGLRAISMMWVVIGHLYGLSINGPIGNLFDAQKYTNDKKNMFMSSANFSVDTFFTVGGVVTLYTFLKASDKGVKFNIFMYYIHRYLRLTPALAIVVLMYTSLIVFMGQGPMWNASLSLLTDNCQNYWWSTLLYIQNFVNVDKECLAQTWYLSVDFQIFLLSPIVLLPLKWRPKIGLSILGVLIAAGAIIPFVIAFVYELPAFAKNTKVEDFWNKFYTQTHTRFGPYVIGMLTGYFVYTLKKNKTKINIRPILTISIWIVTLAGMVACMYVVQDKSEYNKWGHSFAFAFLRNSWAAGVCIIVFMSVFGYGGIINWFLSLPVFQFLTKLSYSIYLTHYAFTAMRYASLKYPFEFSNKFQLWSFWGDFMFILGLSLILCLVFESPVVILEKHIFKIGGDKNKIAPTKIKEDDG